jgi:hypothetical protein
MSQHGTRSLLVCLLVSLLVAAAPGADWSGPRRLSGPGAVGAACVGAGIRAGAGGGSSSEGPGRVPGDGSFNGPLSGAFKEMFGRFAALGPPAAGDEDIAANASRSGERVGVDALDAIGAIGAPGRMAPRIARTCVAHDCVASPRRVGTRHEAFGFSATGDSGRTGVVIERSPRRSAGR